MRCLIPGNPGRCHGRRRVPGEANPTVRSPPNSRGDDPYPPPRRPAPGSPPMHRNQKDRRCALRRRDVGERDVHRLDGVARVLSRFGGVVARIDLREQLVAVDELFRCAPQRTREYPRRPRKVAGTATAVGTPISWASWWTAHSAQSSPRTLVPSGSQRANLKRYRLPSGPVIQNLSLPPSGSAAMLPAPSGNQPSTLMDSQRSGIGLSLRLKPAQRVESHASAWTSLRCVDDRGQRRPTRHSGLGQRVLR